MAFFNKRGAVPDGRQGFALIESLIVMGIVAMLGSAVVTRLDPARQFAQARNAQRESNVESIADAIAERTEDWGGAFETNCAAGPIPTSSARMASSAYDIAPCLVPEYLPAMPFDPSDPDAHYDSAADYDTGYAVERNATTGDVTVRAPSAELDRNISATR